MGQSLRVGSGFSDDFEAIQKFNSALVSQLLTPLFERANYWIGKPIQIPYAFLAIGSVGRQQACPYSDLEATLFG